MQILYYWLSSSKLLTDVIMNPLNVYYVYDVTIIFKLNI